MASGSKWAAGNAPNCPNRRYATSRARALHAQAAAVGRHHQLACGAVAATEPQRREAYFTLSSGIDLASAESILSAARQAAEAKVDEFILCIASLGGHSGRALSIGAILEALPFEFVTFNISMVSSAANVLYIS